MRNGAPLADPFFSSVVALLHFDGTNGSTTYTDQKGHTFSNAGTTALSTAQAKFGTASLLGGGTTSGVSSAASTDWDMGLGDFTAEGFTYCTNTTPLQVLIGNRTGTGSDRGPLVLLQSGQIRGFAGQGTGVPFGDTGLQGSLPTNTWFHWAYVRNGNNFLLFVNGTQVGTTVTSSAACGGTAPLQIGFDPGTTGRQIVGYIDEVRLTKGVGRYTSNFSAPTAAFPNF